MSQLDTPSPWASPAPPPAGYPSPPVPVAAAVPPEAPAAADPARTITFGVPTSAIGHPAVDIVPPAPGSTHEDVARAWITHLHEVTRDLSAVLAILPHGTVRKVLADSGPLVGALVEAGVL